MRNPSLRFVPVIALVLAVALATGYLAIAQTPAPDAAGKGPDILGLQVGISPQEAYTLLQGIDPTHRVAVGQVPIPALLGDKAAVYAMAPESLNVGGEETINVSISLPPNPQQVFQVHRGLRQSIHTTLDQIVASLRQKYGPESYQSPGSTPATPDMYWLFDKQGHWVNPTAAAAAVRACGNNGFVYVTSSGNFPVAPDRVQPGVLSLAYGVNSYFAIPPTADLTKNPQCQGWVRVNALVQGGVNANGVYNYSLDVTIADFDIQKRAAAALSAFLGNLQNQKQQQDLNKAKSQSVPTL